MFWVVVDALEDGYSRAAFLCACVLFSSLLCVTKDFKLDSVTQLCFVFHTCVLTGTQHPDKFMFVACSEWGGQTAFTCLFHPTLRNLRVSWLSLILLMQSEQCKVSVSSTPDIEWVVQDCCLYPTKCESVFVACIESGGDTAFTRLFHTTLWNVRVRWLSLILLTLSEECKSKVSGTPHSERVVQE